MCRSFQGTGEFFRERANSFRERAQKNFGRPILQTHRPKMFHAARGIALPLGMRKHVVL